MPASIAPILALVMAQVAPAVIAQAPAPVPTLATGVVLDAQTNEPIAGALVQQAGSVSSAFTQQDGGFRLLLEKAGGSELTVSMVGYDAATVPVADGRGLRVRLKAQQGFIPAGPVLAPVAIGQSAAETAPLNSGVIFAYRLRQTSQTAPTPSGASATISGLANNDFKLGARFRLKPWLFEAEGAHFETPTDVAGLRNEDNPAFSPSTYQAGARVGYLVAFTPDLEAALSGAYRWTNTVPNNAKVRYTGSDLDFEQTRHAVGGTVTAAWRPGRGRFHLEGALGLYPLVFASSETGGQPYAQNFLSEARVIAGYEVMPGLRAGLGYGFERWQGAGADQSSLYSLQLHYTPGGVPKGNE